MDSPEPSTPAPPAICPRAGGAFWPNASRPRFAPAPILPMMDRGRLNCGSPPPPWGCSSGVAARVASRPCEGTLVKRGWAPLSGVTPPPNREDVGGTAVKRGITSLSPSARVEPTTSGDAKGVPRAREAEAAPNLGRGVRVETHLPRLARCHCRPECDHTRRRACRRVGRGQRGAVQKLECV